MKLSKTLLLLALATIHAPTFAADAGDAEAGLLAIMALGSVNGQALACTELKAAGRAKSLMLAHAPKTARFGVAFDEATQAAYLAQTSGGGSCPDEISLTDRLNQLALQLDAALPVAK